MASTGWDQIAKGVGFEPYSYDAVPALASACAEWPLMELDAAGNAGPTRCEVAAPSDSARADFEERLAAETRRSFEAGRERGHNEGRAAERDAARAAGAEQTAQRAEQLRRLTESFAAQRNAWLEAAEQEVVKLALTIAARILRREAQMDPLLLLGAVRVALGQLASSTQARLRVPARDADLWREAIALLPSRALKPQVIAEEEMRLGDCALESDLGSAELGVRAQLIEIESGFFDRAQSGLAAAGAAQEQR